LVNGDVQSPTDYTFSNNTGVGGLDQVCIKNIKNRGIRIVADGTMGVLANRINLPSGNVDPDTLRVLVGVTQYTRVGADLGTGEFIFVDNGGPGGVDQIYFSTAPTAGDNIDITYYDGNTACAEIFANYTLESNPTSGQELTADYRRTTARTVDVFIPNGNEGPETLTFTPNINVTSYESGETPNLADSGAPVTAMVKDPSVYQYQFGESVFDSLGSDWMLRFICERIEENKWIWFTTNPVETDKIAGYGLILFKGEGQYDADNSQVFESPSDPAGAGSRFKGIYFNPPENPSTTHGAPPPEEGAEVTKIDVYFNKSGITQFSQHVSNADVYYQNGYGMGNLKEVKINEQGVIIGKYDNNKDLDLAQIAVATFVNPSGLEKKGDTYFLESSNSGEPDIGIPDTEKRGIIRPGNLEMSNVDLTQEFIDMIIAERAFMANSRTITTADRLLLDLMRLRP
ncbi:MAG: flagellar hook-basal body complex protein, partial [bacterium]|nr:flagellar hook-basal body complex protein [bacterium]